MIWLLDPSRSLGKLLAMASTLVAIACNLLAILGKLNEENW